MNAVWALVRPLLSTTVRFMHISYIEARSDYQGTTIGILWMPLSTLIFSLVLGTVFHHSGTASPPMFFLFVLSGYVTWNFISDTIAGSTNIIQARLDFAVHSNLSLAGLFGKMLADRLFEFGLNIALLVVALIIVHPASFGPQMLLFVPFVLLLSVTSLAVSYLVNLVTVFFPDLANLIKTAVRFMFFATPVFWTAVDRGDERVFLERYNPAAYYVKMSRQVFGIEPIDWSIWMVGAAITAIVVIAGLIAYQRSHRFVRNIK